MHVPDVYKKFISKFLSLTYRTQIYIWPIGCIYPDMYFNLSATYMCMYITHVMHPMMCV